MLMICLKCGGIMNDKIDTQIRIGHWSHTHCSQGVSVSNDSLMARSREWQQAIEYSEQGKCIDISECSHSSSCLY